MNRFARIFVSLIILALSGCLARENPEPVDYGPEVDVTEILEALNGPTADMSPTTIKLDEFRAYGVTRSVGMGSKTLIQAVGETVGTMNVTANYVEVGLLVQTFDYDELGKPHESRQEGVPYCYDVVPGGCRMPASSMTLAHARIQELENAKDQVAALSGHLTTSASGEKVTYHRFKKWTETVDAPKAVQEQPNCGGIPDCKIKKYWLRFDEVRWKANGEKKSAMSFRVATSPDVPFTSKMLTKCIALMVKVSDAGQSVFYEECSDTFNFSKGP
ncbi:MAG TPA: hypothetical protein VM432_07770 [Bdellovibrionales bacterium]|nr:hypothetical protein [Bdellovibrionales bacterium]